MSTPRNPTWAVSLRLAALFAFVCSAALAAPEKKDFNLQSGDAIATLKTFIEQSGEQIVYPVEQVRGIKTNPVTGSLTPREALDAMLAGTGLHSEQDAKTGALSVTRSEKADPNVARAEASEASRRPGKATMDEDGKLHLENYEVTGSRIRTALDEPSFSPLVSYSREDIVRAGVTSVGELGRLIPQLFNPISTTGDAGVGFGGQATGFTSSDGSVVDVMDARTVFNLRGLTNSSTLVLVDGRRMSRNGQARGGDNYGLDGIPLSMIERIDVLADGASSVYGADALAGVINIILRKDYSTREFTVRYENSFDTDSGLLDFSFLLGETRGKLRVVVTGSYQERNAFAAKDRFFSASDDRRPLGASDGRGFNPRVGGSVTLLSGNIGGRTEFGIPAGSNGMNATLQQYIDAPLTDRLDKAPYAMIISPAKEMSIGFKADYEWKRWANFYFNGRYNEKETYFGGFPVLINSLTVPASAPDNPFGVNVRVSRVVYEQPTIWGKKTGYQSNPSYNAGVKGEIGRWRYDANVAMSRSTFRNINAISPFFPASATGVGGDRLTPVLTAANPADRLRIFSDGLTGPFTSQAVWDSLYFWDPTDERSDQWVYSAQADGPVWELPAGDINLVVGAELVERYVRFIHPGVSNNFRFDVRGSRSSTSNAVFAETSIPIVSPRQNIPLVNHLKLSLSGRRDDYDGFGAADTKSGAVVYAPFKWVTTRYRYSTAYKTPTLAQVHAPQSTLSFIGSPLFLDTLRGNEPVTWSILATTGGNPTVGPETSESQSYGIVIDVPKFLPGLKLSVDQVDYDITDRIASPQFQEAVDFFPENVVRGDKLPGDPAAWPGRVTQIYRYATNMSFLKMSNRDYQVSYRRKFSFGEFNLTGRATEWLKYQTKVNPISPVVESAATFPMRYNTSLYWTHKGWTLGMSNLYQKGYERFVGFPTTFIPSANEWTAHVSRDFGPNAFSKHSWLNKVFADSNIALTVINVFDRRPPPTSGIQNGVQSWAGFAVTDPRMARYTLVVRKAF